MSWTPIIILVLLGIGAALMIAQAIKKKGVKKQLERKNFKVDHYWGFGTDYLALDLENRKIALKGGMPLKHSRGEGIYEVSQVQSADTWKDPDDQTISIIVMPQMGKISEYVVHMGDANEYRECLGILRDLGIDPPGDLDITYI